MNTAEMIAATHQRTIHEMLEKREQASTEFLNSLNMSVFAEQRLQEYTDGQLAKIVLKMAMEHDPCVWQHLVLTEVVRRLDPIWLQCWLDANSQEGESDA